MNQYYNLYLVLNDNKVKVKVNIKDLFEINYEGTCLKYYEEIGDYFECLINIYDGGVWINSKELIKYGFSPIDWKTFLISEDRCYHPISLKEILIHNNEDNIIDTLRRGENVVKLINEIKNDYVKVEIYKENESGGCSDIKTGSGWIKIIDNNGRPKIFFYTRGC